MFLRHLPSLVMGCTLLTTGAAQAEFADLLAKVPRDSNLVVLVNAEKAFGSKVGVAEGWRQSYRSNSDQAPLRMPPEASEYVLAATIDLATLSPRRETAVARLESDLPMTVVARLTEGVADKIGGLEALAMPRGGYLVKFGPHEYGLTAPSDRQAASRWVREASGRARADLSPYLAEAAEYPDRVGTEFILALDLAGALGESAVRRALSGSKVLADGGVDLDDAARVLASVRGMTLGVRTTERVVGSLKFDFAEPVDAITTVAKPLLIEVLEEGGVAFEEAYDWAPGTAEKSVRISGEMSVASLRRLMSFLELDAAAIGQPQEGGESIATDPDYQAQQQATLDYFHGIEEHLHDLKREHGAKSYYSIGRWFEKYANRIDRMPILGVDPTVVDFGAHIVSQMRDCVEAIKGAGIQSGARGASVSSSSYYSSDDTGNSGNSLFGGGYGDQVDAVRGQESQRRAIRTEERAKSSTTVRGVVRQMQEDTSRMRRELTQKYQVEF
ncbi:hypothetical protein Mal64_30230 [Pseudobythopirellula maris]|uniref:Uncharacterized protein n=1 Tax=Pseudobythopirellula maris TaxID=2527991 RepID=A0A5C5ZJD3_9BACT|nr:hypothetical protein [Pseudobythopirellula maris]TWT87484.1 hypothetical protein Mal64_30230 [Pseudobythopirellula maris]